MDDKNRPRGLMGLDKRKNTNGGNDGKVQKRNHNSAPPELKRNLGMDGLKDMMANSLEMVANFNLCTF